MFILNGWTKQKIHLIAYKTWSGKLNGIFVKHLSILSFRGKAVDKGVVVTFLKCQFHSPGQHDWSKSIKFAILW